MSPEDNPLNRGTGIPQPAADRGGGDSGKTMSSGEALSRTDAGPREAARVQELADQADAQENPGQGRGLDELRVFLSTDESSDAAVDAVLTASRAMIAVAVRSLSAVAEDITIAQYRTLVVLASRGPQKLADLAEQLGVTPPTAGRMCDRLARRSLVTRHRAHDDRRVVRISLTREGRQIVDNATERRRVFLARILADLPARQRHEVAAALRAFANAAGEVPDEEWPRGPMEAAGQVLR